MILNILVKLHKFPKTHVQDWFIHESINMNVCRRDEIYPSQEADLISLIVELFFKGLEAHTSCQSVQSSFSTLPVRLVLAAPAWLRLLRPYSTP